MESPAKKEKKVELHPKISVMVDAAIKTLAEPKGSSLHAIGKYMTANYNVDVKKLSGFIKRYLKSAVERGDIIQPTGKGASGSFKISKNKKEAKPKIPKTKSPKSLKMQTSTPKKTLKPKKATITKSPGKSPVKKVKSKDDEETPADVTIIKPKKKITKKTKISLPTNPRKSKVSLPAKIKKPKKLMSKPKKLQSAVSPKPKFDKATTSPKKAKGTTKSTKPKKSLTPGKPAASKKAVSKKVSINDKK